MDSSEEKERKIVRPYFVPDGVEWDALPPGLRVALEALVAPAYQELVVDARNALERSAGSSLTFLLVQEILEQFSITADVDLTAVQKNFPARRQEMDPHLRLLNAKQKIANFIQRMAEVRRAAAAAAAAQG